MASSGKCPLPWPSQVWACCSQDSDVDIRSNGMLSCSRTAILERPRIIQWYRWELEIFIQIIKLHLEWMGVTIVRYGWHSVLSACYTSTLCMLHQYSLHVTYTSVEGGAKRYPVLSGICYFFLLKCQKAASQNLIWASFGFSSLYSFCYNYNHCSFDSFIYRNPSLRGV